MIEPIVHIVDDDQSFLAASSRFLRSSGFRVRICPSAVAFMAHRRLDEPGCVIADLQTPDVDGLQLQSALAQAPNPLPVLFLSGQPDTASIVPAMRGDAEDFREKTAEQDEVLGAVRRALARDQQAREERCRRQAARELFDAISPRERDVLVDVLRGRLNKQIAERSGHPRADCQGPPQVPDDEAEDPVGGVLGTSEPRSRLDDDGVGFHRGAMDCNGLLGERPRRSLMEQRLTPGLLN